ncbi:adccff4a-7c86-460b-9831-70005cb4a6a3 [Thermothielavioides terrestris]|nr:adccff4a-7c86-460b-9831-70005cb4a6a3 [Thermothielavioides terrestris]
MASSYGNFSRTCTDIKLVHTFFLRATCCNSSTDGVEAQSHNELILPMCIGMDQVSGYMKWEVYGKFSNFCKNCTMLEAAGGAKYLYTCACTPLIGDRGPIWSTLNLDDGISNNMGTLQCAGGKANMIDPNED